MGSDKEALLQRNMRVRRKFEVLEKHCEDVGRPYRDIERTAATCVKLASDAIDVSEVVEICRQMAELSFQHVVFNMPNIHEIRPIEIIGREVIPQVADIN